MYITYIYIYDIYIYDMYIYVMYIYIYIYICYVYIYIYDVKMEPRHLDDLFFSEYLNNLKVPNI